MTKPKKVHPYYDYRKLWSYNAVFNMVVGGRGLGKTYGAKRQGIINAIKKGEEFIYLRRHSEELKAAKSTFFADIGDEFPDHEFRLHGNKAQMTERVEQRDDETEAEFEKRKKKRKWVTLCYFIALSVAQTQKGTSFPLVTLIVFDEFIIEKATMVYYLRDEVTALLNFYSTVDRYQDKTRVLMLANSVSIMNPYFTKWEIRPDRLPEISTAQDGMICAHFPDSKRFTESIYQTRFGKFIAGTEYGAYAAENSFADAHDQLIAEKTKNAKYKYTLETSEGVFSLWYDISQGIYYAQAKRPGNERVLTLVAENMDTGKIRVTYSEPVIRSLRHAFNRGKVMFDKPSSRNAFTPIFDRT